MTNRFELFSRLSRSALGKLLLLGALVLVLRIPIGAIGQLGVEREETRAVAASDVAQSWGGAQQVLGPFLVVPYRELTRSDSGAKIAGDVTHAIFLPERLHVEANIDVQSRSRGLFELPVYVAQVTLRGRIAAADAKSLQLPAADFPADVAQLVLQLGDVHAVDAAPVLRWNGVDIAFEPGATGLGKVAGLHAMLPANAVAHGGEFVVSLTLRGSGAFSVAPLGRETEVTLKSNWPHPSFQGAWLPNRHEIDARGFSASWSIPYVARSFPAAWTQSSVSDQELQRASFGVALNTPVDPYRMSERSLKYAELFIGLTFLAVWLFELKSGMPAHAVQYLLVGAGLCVFYLLELALAEHVGFAAAYAVASTAVVLQVGLYSRAVLRSTRRSGAIAALVASLYTLLWVLLREEDFALLTGSVGVFVALCAVMFLTRRVQWSSPSPAAEAAP
jgi:inner membrane protein